MKYLLEKLNTFRDIYVHDQLFMILVGLYLIIPLFFTTFFHDAFDTPKLMLLSFGVGIALIIWIFKKQNQLKYHNSWFVSIASFFVFICISALFAPDKIYSIFGHYLRPTNSVLFFGLWCLLLAFIVQVIEEQRIFFLYKIIGISSTIISVYFILQSFDIGYYAGIETQSRSLAPGFLGNPNFSAMFLSGVIPLYILLSSLSKNFLSKFGWWIASIVAVFGLIMMSSRASIISVIIVSSLIFVYGAYKKMPRSLILHSLAILFSTLILAGLFYNTYRPDSVSNTSNFSDRNISNRILLWQDGIDMMSKQPFVGVGPGNFYSAFKQNANSVWTANERFDDAHNVFLHIGASDGLFSLLAFLLIILIPITVGIKRLFQHNSPLLLLTIAGLAGLIFSMGFNPVVIPCWMLLALFLGVLINEEAKEKSFSISSWFKLPLFIIGLCFVMYSFIFSISEVLEYHSRTLYLDKNFSTSLTYARAAAYINPFNYEASIMMAVNIIELDVSNPKVPLLLEKVMREHSTSSEILGYCQAIYHQLYKKSGNLEYKKRGYQIANDILRLGSNHISVYNQLGYFYFANEDWENAQQMMYHNIIALNDQFYPWTLLAQIYLELNKTKQLEFALKNINTINPVDKNWRSAYEYVKNGKNISELTLPIRFPEFEWKPQ